MDKKDGGTIDLESLRGFTPGPWRAGDEHGAEQLRPSIRILRDVTYVEGARPTTYVIGEATYPTTVGNTVGAEERRANAALIAAAPSMHAELLARRARDAEVEALVAALREAMGWNWLDEDASPSKVADQCEKALAPFIGDKT